MAVITVHEAEIHTAQVEIKTLTIKGKQCTLAMFRQFITEDYLDSEAKPNGLLWGTVNYHPGRECDDVGEHYHVVWQKGSELRRAIVKAGTRPEAHGFNENEKWLDIALLQGWRPNGEPQYYNQHNYHSPTIRVRFPNGLIYAFVQHEAAHLLNTEYNVHHGTYLSGGGFYEDGKGGVKDSIEKLRAKVEADGRTLDELRDLIMEEIDIREKYWDEFEQRWVEIQSSPQLFIAV